MDICLKVERLEETRVFLKDEKGRLIIWPRDWFPAELSIGENFNIYIGDNKKSENILAKNILNEILNA